MITRSARLTALTSISGRLIELRCTPRSIQRSKKNVIDGIGRAHDDVGTLDRLLQQADGNDFDAEHRGHGGGEGFAALRIGAEAMDGRDVAHRAGRHELRTRLPAGAENADALRILAGEVLDA